MTSWSGNFRTKRLVHADGLVPFQTPKELEYSVELVPAHQGVFLLCGLHHVQFARPTHRKQVQQITTIKPGCQRQIHASLDNRHRGLHSEPWTLLWAAGALRVRRRAVPVDMICAFSRTRNTEFQNLIL